MACQACEERDAASSTAATWLAREEAPGTLEGGRPEPFDQGRGCGSALDLGDSLGGPSDQSMALVCWARGHFLKAGGPEYVRHGDVVAAGQKPARNSECIE
jgi:hypothetical protein